MEPMAMSTRTTTATSTAATDPAHDFDFLFGHWRVHNRRLRARLSGCNDWETFESRVDTHPLPGRLGNREHFHTDWDGGYHGLAIRLFEPATARWRIWWASDRSPLLESPVVGGFDGDVGVFLSRIAHDGCPVLCRYRWTRIDADYARWDQAYSPDDGAGWESNWEMDFRRARDDAHA